MNILFALSGLHRHNRGAEQAFISIASELAKAGNGVTLIGSGRKRENSPYRFLQAGSIRREKFERFPTLPALRDECGYEELSFVPALLCRYTPSEYDIVVTCSYPFTNWILRSPVLRGTRPPHVFVTQNGDLAPQSRKSEFRFFSCEGLVCTNPEFYERNKSRWRSKFIPNGVDLGRFSPGPAERERFGLPKEGSIVLMVSALIETKRVEVGIEAVSKVANAHLVVAGDGPLRETIEKMANVLLPRRFTRLSVAPDSMPMLYRSANLFLHLAKHESSPLAFFEAMACGLPTVAHDSPQLRWIAEKDEYLIDTEDVVGVAKEIESARGEAPARIKTRLAKVNSFSWTSIAQSYESFFREILASP